MKSRLLLTSLALLLAGCDNIPGLGPDPRVLQKEADGKAIGSACRHALRGIEDCYVLNPKASKTAVFTGWKEMDQYMRENNIEGQRPAILAPEANGGMIEEKKAEDGKDASDKGAASKSKPAASKSSSKAADKEKEEPASKAEKH